jgi:hypothetical protein
LESTDKTGEKAYSGLAGFDFDDLLYLFAPAAWFGWFIYMLVGAAAVAPILALLTAWRLHTQAGRSG